MCREHQRDSPISHGFELSRSMLQIALCLREVRSIPKRSKVFRDQATSFLK